MKEHNGEHPHNHTGQLILLGLFLIVWLADSFFLDTSTVLSEYASLLIRLVIAGLALLMTAFLFRSCIAAFSHDEGPSGVISGGGFRYVRHPMYLGCILFYLGLAISTGSLYSIAMLVMIFVFYDYMATYEEKLLELRFGEGYRSYKKRTGKWVPRFGKGNIVD